MSNLPSQSLWFSDLYRQHDAAIFFDTRVLIPSFQEESHPSLLPSQQPNQLATTGVCRHRELVYNPTGPKVMH